jgi:aspartyl-tRNA synthetase
MTRSHVPTHHCNELRKTDIGREVKLAGWVRCGAITAASFSSIYAIAKGLTQVVFRPEENAEVAKQSHSLRTGRRHSGLRESRAPSPRN